MIILMLFNECDTWTLKDLKKETCIGDSDLVRELQSLVWGKMSQRILSKKSQSQSIKEDDIFWVNDEFSSKSYKVKVKNFVSLKYWEGECKMKEKILEEDRKHEVEAAIIRILKRKNRIDHKTLLENVKDELKGRFIPSSSLIKRRINELIGREYLDRCPENK